MSLPQLLQFAGGEPGLDISGPLLLLALAIAVALATRFVRIPYTVALVFVGLLIGISTEADTLLHIPADKLLPDLIFLILLPPLLFEGCVNIDLELFRRGGLAILLWAFLGTAITAAIVGFGLHQLFGPTLGLTPAMALLIGVVVSPTDPVSVLALFKELGVKRELAVLVEGESVLNDGVGVVLFLILLKLIGGEPLTVANGVGIFFWEVGGGLLLGLTIGYLAFRLLAKIDDHLVEVIISLVVAYGAYLVADRVEASGVLSVVACGLVVGNYGKTFGMSPTTRLTLTSFWEVLAFIANSLVFLLIGLKLDGGMILTYAGPIVTIFLLGLVGRAVAVWSLGWVAIKRGQRLPYRWLPVIWWSGVRGSIPIAMALGLLGGEAGLQSFQVREIVAVVFGVVLLSLSLQGLTIKPLLRRLGLNQRHPVQEQLESALGQTMALNASLSVLEEMHDEREVTDAVYDELVGGLSNQRDELRELIRGLVQEHPDLRLTQAERAATRVLHAQRAAIDTALQRGIIAEEARELLGQDVDARLHTHLGVIFTLPEPAKHEPAED